MENNKTKILITGATGNVGFEVIKYLLKLNTGAGIFAGVRNISEAKNTFQGFNNLHFRSFDFENQQTWEEAFFQTEIVFLLRPPHISDTERYFRPLVHKMKKCGVKKILFLSVQGAEKSKIIPHNKIEKLICESRLEYVFLRPSYFMQNLTTTLLPDIKQYRKIVLPSGKAVFNWIDVENIGEIAAHIINNFESFKNNAFELTGDQNLNFYEVAGQISEITGRVVIFENVSPLRFYLLKRKQKLPAGKIIVMILLHYLPKFQPEPKISNFYKNSTGKNPTTIKEFITKNREVF